MADSKQRETLFSQAFPSKAKKDLPQPHKSFRWNTNKVSRLSFVEQYNLQEFENKHFRELPDWILDAGLAIPSDEEKAFQREAEKATGFSQSERNQVLDTKRADAEALASMVNSKILAGTEALDSEISFYQARYGAELIEMLKSVDADVSKKVESRIKLKAAELKAKQEKEAAEKDLEQAKLAIASMKANPAAFEAAIRGSEVID